MLKIMDKPITELKPIETKYRGYLFRSRLEARWAVFMDALNIEWLYEHEGYDLEGLWYLPDFYLPSVNDGCFLEVKPFTLSTIEKEKVNRLCLISLKIVIVAIGLPEHKELLFIYPDNCNGKINTDFDNFYLNKIGINNFIDPLSEEYSTAVDLAKGARF